MSAPMADERLDLLASVPFHPLLFASYPVLRLYGENLSEVGAGEVVVPLLVTIGAAALGLVLASLLFRDARRGAIVTSAVVLIVLLFGAVRDVLGAQADEARLGLVGAAGGIVLVAVIASARVGPRLKRATTGLNLIALLLVIVASVPALQGLAATATEDPDATVLERLEGDDGSTIQRDVYHLVLDRYGSAASLEAGFGIDNSDFIAWLREHGFQVVDEAFANYAKTTLSLGATLGVDPLDDIAARMGPRSENLAPVVARIRRSRAGRFLQDQGYEYVHVGSWFRQTRDSAIADRSYDPGREVTFASTLYESTILPELVPGSGPGDAFDRRHAEAAEFQWALLEELASEPGPTYVFAHLLVPHPPYVFLADGRFDPRAATFESQLQDTNRRLRAFLEPLLALPEEERPIVILQGDEGPFPTRLEADQDGFDWATATDAEVLTKFGILDAMLLPGPEGAAPLPSHRSAINTYPELFRRYFGSDIGDRPDRILASTRARPYRFIDLTERVAAIRLASARVAGRS